MLDKKPADDSGSLTSSVTMNDWYKHAYDDILWII